MRMHPHHIRPFHHIKHNIRPSSLSATTFFSTPPRNANLSTSLPHLKKATQLPPRPTLPDQDLKHKYLKGSGPGGQKINKTSSAVQLTHLPTGIVVKSQATRSRSQNHNIAKRILAEKIEFIERGQESRKARVVERLKKRKASADKKKRRKYRKLAEEAGVAGAGADHQNEDDGGVELSGEGGEGLRT